jgi:hypothetical protein
LEKSSPRKFASAIIPSGSTIRLVIKNPIFAILVARKIPEVTKLKDGGGASVDYIKAYLNRSSPVYQGKYMINNTNFSGSICWYG